MVSKDELRELKKRFFSPQKDTPERKVAPALIEARKLIGRCGWVRGALCLEGEYCVVGALLAVEQNMEVQELAFDVIRAECGYRFVTHWNDLVAQSEREVTDMLARAADRARALLRPGEPQLAGPDRSSIYS